MSPTRKRIAVYAERGSTRVFAGALAWPGWCRGARSEPDALDALVAYGPRFAQVVEGTGLRFSAPTRVDDLEVTERLEGTPTTDFGAPDVAPADDDRPVRSARARAALHDPRGLLGGSRSRRRRRAAGSPCGRGLAGGGRNLDAIVVHVLGAESSYLGRLAAPKPAVNPDDLDASAAEIREATIGALRRAVTEGLPASGPRGGRIWLPRYFVRRDAWHVLDHAWEIQDRSGSSLGCGLQIRVVVPDRLGAGMSGANHHHGDADRSGDGEDARDRECRARPPSGLLGRAPEILATAHRSVAARSSTGAPARRRRSSATTAARQRPNTAAQITTC